MTDAKYTENSDHEVEPIMGTKLEVIKLAGSSDLPYDFPIPGISPSHVSCAHAIATPQTKI
jgi:hypothetical protein